MSAETRTPLDPIADLTRRILQVTGQLLDTELAAEQGESAEIIRRSESTLVTIAVRLLRPRNGGLAIGSRYGSLRAWAGGRAGRRPPRAFATAGTY